MLEPGECPLGPHWIPPPSWPQPTDDCTLSHVTATEQLPCFLPEVAASQQ